MSRYRDPQLQVGENYPYLFYLRPNICKYWCLNTRFNPINSKLFVIIKQIKNGYSRDYRAIGLDKTRKRRCFAEQFWNNGENRRLITPTVGDIMLGKISPVVLGDKSLVENFDACIEFVLNIPMHCWSMTITNARRWSFAEILEGLYNFKHQHCPYLVIFIIEVFILFFILPLFMQFMSIPRCSDSP